MRRHPYVKSSKALLINAAHDVVHHTKGSVTGIAASTAVTGAAALAGGAVRWISNLPEVIPSNWTPVLLTSEASASVVAFLLAALMSGNLGSAVSFSGDKANTIKSEDHRGNDHRAFLVAGVLTAMAYCVGISLHMVEQKASRPSPVAHAGRDYISHNARP